MNEPCVDCGAETLSQEPGEPTEYYMVRDEVWEAAGMHPPGGCLCIGCLEARLGRQLCPRDFTPVDVNDPLIRNQDQYAWTWRSDRLRDRLTDDGARIFLGWLDGMSPGEREAAVSGYVLGRHRQRLADKDRLTSE
jgi:hypothetical protein